MGLLLSVLVTCVGVIELLTFYHNVKRRVNYRKPETNLNSVRDQYLQDLEGVRDKLVQQLHFLKSQEIVPTHSSIPTFRLNSHEDIDVKFNDKIVARSKSTSPRRFLVKEQTSSSSPTRQFVVTEEPQALQGIKKSHAQECIPEFLIEKQTAADVPRYVLKDENGPVQLPLPNTFVVSEDEKESKNDVFKKKLGHSVVEVDGEIYYRRSPSPFPSFDLSAPRNSVCSELLDNSVSVAEIDELARSTSHSPQNVSYETSIEINNNTEKNIISENSSSCTENRNSRSLTRPLKKSKSRSPSPNTFKKYKKSGLQKGTLARCRSKSESNALSFISSEQTSSTTAAELENFDETNASSLSNSENYDNALNVYSEDLERLDGIDKTKENTKKKLFNKKKNKDRSTSEDKSDLAETKTACIPETLPFEKNDSSTAESLVISESSSERKSGKPFWLIFSGEYTKAMNKDFHGQHFCCWQCDESLTGQRYVLRDDHPYCVSCYESVFANACEKCSRIIGIDSKDLSYKDKHWHEACFLCTTCGESLVDKQFGSKGDRIYCGRCYDEQFASRCDGCHEIFRAGTKKMEYKTRQWHEKCFCCCVCKVPIGTQSFIPREQEIYCAKCYEEKFATRCIKCNKVITSGGVTYKNEPWHRECFTCTHCQKSLAGERFTSRDEKPYCADCFGELFAKRCFACNRPITGIGGTKFISFEDRHWHNDCFFCASCNTSLVGRGFITDQEDIICPECAKQKLM